MIENQKYASKTSIALMLLGLLPFVFTIYYLQKYDFEHGIAIFIHYSAIILSFIGAINWGRNFLEKSPMLFYLSVAPSIIAFSAFFFSFPNNLLVLAIGYFVAWVIDIFLLVKRREFIIYLVMRSVITTAVIYMHLYLL